MSSRLLAALVTSLALTGCVATTGNASGGPAVAASDDGPAPEHPEQMSISHPYCMYVRHAGGLRECQQFAFGHCTGWGDPCTKEGWVERPGQPDAATPPATPVPAAQ